MRLFILIMIYGIIGASLLKLIDSEYPISDGWIGGLIGILTGLLAIFLAILNEKSLSRKRKICTCLKINHARTLENNGLWVHPIIDPKCPLHGVEGLA